jgi:phage shock protein PspC (stress-responsive transcriptional regulator)
MKRVVIINLAGRAVHVEEAGEALLDAWMQRSMQVLTSDPDRDEIMADFEALLADRFHEAVQSSSHVVTESAVAAVLSAIGEVPSAEPGISDSPENKPDDVRVDEERAESAPKRFYRLPEGSQLGGVCAGVAAYFNLDVTIVRILAVLLFFLTQGFALVVYLIVWAVAPQATTAAERAALRGQGGTAAEIAVRVRTSAQPMLTTAGRQLRQVGAYARPVVRGVSAVLLGIVGLLYGLAISLQQRDSFNLFSGMSEAESWWLAQIWLLAGVWALAAPLVLIYRLSAKRSNRRGKLSGPVVAFGACAWIAATIVVVTVPLVQSADLRMLMTKAQGRVMVGGTHYCIVNVSAVDSTRDLDRVRTQLGCKPDDVKFYVNPDW